MSGNRAISVDKFMSVRIRKGRASDTSYRRTKLVLEHNFKSIFRKNSRFYISGYYSFAIIQAGSRDTRGRFSCAKIEGMVESQKLEKGRE